MILTFRPIDRWPEGWQQPKTRKPNPFRSTYAQTLDDLDRELEYLRARDAFMQVDATSADVRLDGQLRANAKVNHPGVILTIDTRDHGVLVYPCDTFESRYHSDGPSWQVNLRAIAGGLEALRKVERYGIADRGQQYAGFGALPPATAMGAAMTVEAAALLLANTANQAFGEDWCDPQALVDEAPDQAEIVRGAYRDAVKVAHPDAGGDAELFRDLTAARDLLLGDAS